jgi:hypothetical protein
MIRGKSFKLFVISTIMTHRETVIRIEPPRKEAAPSKAYLKGPHKNYKKHIRNKTTVCSKLYMYSNDHSYSQHFKQSTCINISQHRSSNRQRSYGGKSICINYNAEKTKRGHIIVCYIEFLTQRNTKIR